MLLVAAILGIGALIGLGLGGNPQNLAATQIKWWPVLPAALLLQVIPVPRDGSLPFIVLVGSYAGLAVVAAVNWRLFGFPAILLGVLLNAFPIVLNQGMPVSREAVREAGGSVEEIPPEPGGKHHLATSEDQLRELGDVIAVREPFRTVVSIGDLVMYFGAATFLAAAMLGRSERRSKTTEHPRPAPPSTMWESPR